MTQFSCKSEIIISSSLISNNHRFNDPYGFSAKTRPFLSWCERFVAHIYL